MMAEFDGYALEYFSDDIKNDFECCKVSIVEGFSGYRYIGNDMKMNKELGLMEINNCHGIKEINKELRKDKDIIEAYWNSVDRKPITYTTAGDTFLTEDNLGDIIEWLYVNKFSNKNIEILKFKIDINEPTLKIDKTLFKGKFYIFQIVSNEVNSDFSSDNYIWTIVKQLKDNNIDYEIHLHDSCNINDIEIYALKVR